MAYEEIVIGVNFFIGKDNRLYSSFGHKEDGWYSEDCLEDMEGIEGKYWKRIGDAYRNGNPDAVKFLAGFEKR